MNSNLQNMDDPKVTFSTSELSLMMNSEFILTKNRVISNIYELFGSLSTALVSEVESNAPAWVEQVSGSPKISKGEQYQGFPWVMLDYPRIFSREKGFLALRTFFWWGHYFTAQWLISGSFYSKLNIAIKTKGWPFMINGCQLYAGFSSNPWINELPQEGILCLEAADLSEEGFPDGVFKLAIKVPINQWTNIPDNVLALCKLILEGE
jgi:hypothetical protein